MKYFGIWTDEHVKRSRFRKVILFVLCSLPIMFILVPNMAYFIVFYHSEDVLGITDLIYTIFLFFGVWNGYIIIAFRQEHLRKLIDELKWLIAKSERADVH